MKIVRENINEKFSEEGDPIADMGIGQVALIRKWFERYAPKTSYTIDKDLNITVYDYLYLKKSDATEIPNNLIVKGCIELGWSKIKKLPKNLTIHKDLDLRYSKVSEIPTDIKVYGSMYIYECPVKELPDNLHVGGSLYLNTNRHITNLPNNLHVGENLDISGTQITKLPKTLIVKGKIYKNFNVTLVRENINEKFSEEGDPIKDLGVGKLGMFKDLEKRGVRMWFNWENGEKEKLKIIENIVEITNLVNKLEATGCKPEEMEIIRSKDVRVKGCRVVINNSVVATCLTEKEAKIFIKCAKKFTMWNNNYTFQIRTNDFSEESVMVDPTQHRWLDNLIENRKNAKA